MKFKITYMNPITGEPESKLVTQEDCWAILNSVYSKSIPEKRIKPINIKIELLLDGE